MVGHPTTLLILHGLKREAFRLRVFMGFSVAAAGHTMECSKRIPKLKVTLGNYTVIETFYVVHVPDINVVLGVQWLYSTNYQTMEMEFTGAEGQKVVLRGMNNYPPIAVTSHRMEVVL